MGDHKLEKPARATGYLPRQVEEHRAGHTAPDPLAQAITRVGDAASAGAHADALSRVAGGQPSLAGDALLQLQHTHGNHHVQRVLHLARQANGKVEVAPEVEEAIQQARGGGQPLDSSVRAQMESAFGTDFGSVRVHTGGEADTLNRALSARAFTTGQDVFFRRGAYDPSSASGRELLAHELTHVVQQAGDEIRCKPIVNQPEGKRQDGRVPAMQELDRLADRYFRYVRSRIRTLYEKILLQRRRGGAKIKKIPKIARFNAGKIVDQVDARVRKALRKVLRDVPEPKVRSKELFKFKLPEVDIFGWVGAYPFKDERDRHDVKALEEFLRRYALDRLWYLLRLRKALKIELPEGLEVLENVQQSSRPGTIQPKLQINQPGDRYEQEADRVAEQVMETTEHTSPQNLDDIDKEKEIPPLPSRGRTAALTSSHAGDVPDSVSKAIESTRSQPLDTATRNSMESRFDGYDFSQVRVHTDRQAAEAAQTIGAKAFTLGSDIVFGADQYAPRTEKGMRLLAHELVHVIQQKDSASPSLQRSAEDLVEHFAYLMDPRNVFLDDPAEVAKFEKDFAGTTVQISVLGKRTIMASGTKFGKHGEYTFITATGDHGCLFKYKNTIRRAPRNFFDALPGAGFQIEVMGGGLHESARAIVPIAKTEALFVMVVLQPKLLLDVAGNIIQGKSPIDEDAMRGYLAGQIFAPLGKQTSSTVTNVFLGDVIKPAAEEAFKQLAKDGKLKPDTYSRDFLVSVFSGLVGRKIAALPPDSQHLLQSANDTLREVAGGLISQEVGAAAGVGEELVK